MRPCVKSITASDTVLFTIGDAVDSSVPIPNFRFDLGTQLKGRASDTGVNIVLWPMQAVFSVVNTTAFDQTINLYLLNPGSSDQVPILPPNFKLGAGCYAIFSPSHIVVYAPDGSTTSLRQEYTGTWADPNGNIIPDNPKGAASYYKDQDGTEIGSDYVEFRWSVTNQRWFKTEGN